jgi:hypothetical protein
MLASAFSIGLVSVNGLGVTTCKHFDELYAPIIVL